MLSGVCDIHCHLLPGFDDGPRTPEQSLEIARLLVAQGVSTVVCTPHASAVEAIGGAQALDRELEGMRRLIVSRGIGLALLRGCEHRLLPEMVEGVRRGELVTLNDTSYILVELDFFQYPPYTEEVLFYLRLAGLTPVLAHPERQAVLAVRPNMLARLMERYEVVSQITATSITGEMGEEAYDSAWHLLREGLVHLVASDTHHPVGSRRPALDEAFQLLAESLSEETAETLVLKNPARLVRGEPLLRVQPAGRPRRRWFLF